MAKSGEPKSGQPKSGGGGGKARTAAAAFPDALKEAGQRAAELAQNPVARSMMAAGLVAAAAARTANSRVRKTVSDASRDALDTAEAAADSATKIGAAIVTAATEAVRRMLSPGGSSAGGSSAGAGSSTGRGKSGGASARKT